jgi:nucleoside 2-deoxyribosyltransferase
MNTIALIGEIYVDVTLGQQKQQHKMRLGGIMHAARTAWALKIPYVLYYIAPSYLVSEIEKYALAHGCLHLHCIGIISDSSNVILIGEPKEIGDQEYSLLNSQKTLIDVTIPDHENEVGSILVLPGSYSLHSCLKQLSLYPPEVKVYIDIANELYNIRDLSSLDRKFSCTFNSTSCSHAEFNKDLLFDWNIISQYTDEYILKENRGGGRLYDMDGRHDYPAFVRRVSHSIGVGDAFDVAYIYFNNLLPKNLLLRRSSFIAALYGSTSFPDDLYDSIQNFMEDPSFADSLWGLRVPWEMRPNYKIYVAGPDFDWVDTNEIRKVESALKYHNYDPCLPIKAFGQLSSASTQQEISHVFESDILKIQDSDLIIVVILNGDSGTLVELGYGVGIGKKVIVYDPNRISTNPMVTLLSHSYLSEIEDLLNEVFNYASHKV